MWLKNGKGSARKDDTIHLKNVVLFQLSTMAVGVRCAHPISSVIGDVLIIIRISNTWRIFKRCGKIECERGIHSSIRSLAHKNWHSCVWVYIQFERKWCGRRCLAVDAKAFINPRTISTSDTYSKYYARMLAHVFSFFPLSYFPFTFRSFFIK